MHIVDATQPSTADVSVTVGSNSFRGRDTGLDFDYAHDVAQSLGIRPGTGVTVAHFDEGWELEHPSFSWTSEDESRIEFLGELPVKRGRFAHGNSVLGLHLGIEPEGGFHQALLPGARFLLVQSLDKEESSSNKLLELAIERLRNRLPAVLLVARDWSSRAPHLPYELKPGAAKLLKRATDAGIVVVQSAGNAGLDLGSLVRRTSGAIRNQVTVHDDSWIMNEDDVGPAFEMNTGAIVVGACTSGLPHQRWTAGFPTNPQPRSNFGDRVDCWAHGDRISTASFSPTFTDDFGGTSSAAAIVAAGVAVVQSIAIARSAMLSVEQIGQLVRAPEMGRPVFNNESTIGSVPNLKEIIDHLGGR